MEPHPSKMSPGRYGRGMSVTHRTHLCYAPEGSAKYTELLRTPLARSTVSRHERVTARPAPAPSRRLLRSAVRGTSAQSVCSFGTLMTKNG
jgi:hypothetical protein